MVSFFDMGLGSCFGFGLCFGLLYGLVGCFVFGIVALVLGGALCFAGFKG